MKKTVFNILLLAAAMMSASSIQAQTSPRQGRNPLPVYLDESKNIEQRIDDALSRMTLNEKIRVIHAQSKFS
ncbi:MAG: hypothetical protein J5734_01325, partial [Prevotella sp.]|nr:hypothetical protein [Prevotella sp.]